MVQPGSGRFSQIAREELDDEEIVVRSSLSTREVVILQLDTEVGFVVIFGDVVRCSKAPWEMNVAHGAFEHLWTKPFRAETASFAIIMAPATWVSLALLGPRAIVP
jgi:hypothetical protein